MFLERAAGGGGTDFRGESRESLADVSMGIEGAACTGGGTFLIIGAAFVATGGGRFLRIGALGPEVSIAGTLGADCGGGGGGGA